MIKLILVRHGKTTCNEKGALSGLTDSVLSETGKLQSQKIADYLKYTNIDKIYTTPFKRTKETIEKLAETKNIKVEESSQLNEINFGDFEGLRNGRYFTDFTEETFAVLISGIPSLSVEKQWITGDARTGRENEKWLNVILKKVNGCSGTDM